MKRRPRTVSDWIYTLVFCAVALGLVKLVTGWPP
jgi:hypothetical protein